MTEILGLDTGANLILRVSSDVTGVVVGVEARVESTTASTATLVGSHEVWREVCLQQWANEDNSYPHNLSVGVCVQCKCRHSVCVCQCVRVHVCVV